jgi:hypothetical protein
MDKIGDHGTGQNRINHGSQKGAHNKIFTGLKEIICSMPKGGPESSLKVTRTIMEGRFMFMVTGTGDIRQAPALIPRQGDFSGV